MDQGTAENIIELLEAIDLNDEEAYDQIINILNSNIKGFKPIKFELNHHDDLFYARARILDNVDDYVNEISGHSYNPNLDKIGFGRANNKGQQVFYLGRTRVTAFAEVNIIENRKEEMEVGYALSRWMPIKKLKIGAILDPNTMNQIEAFEVEGLVQFLNENFNKFQNDKSKIGSNKLYTYFSNRFRERIVKGEENKYKITSALSNFIFSQNPDLDGLMYQSVKWPGSYNLAITKNAVDEYGFKPTHFIKMVFLRKEIDDLVERSFEVAKSFDENANTIIW